jgi:hypothetical protein
MEMLGWGPAWLPRVPALLLSLFTIAAAARLGRRHSSGAAAFLALAMAMAPGPSYYGRTATPYALTLFVVVLGAELVLRAVAGRRSDWTRLAWLLSVSLLCHYGIALPAAGLLLGAFVLSRTRSADPDALVHAVRAGAPALVPPLLWSVVHFAWFPTVALDTRLYADAYPPDPGLMNFALRMFTTTLGAPAGEPFGAFAILPLLALGVADLWRRSRPMTSLLLILAGAWGGAVLFFHQSLTLHLGEHVFWGFRWVAWGGPVLFTLAAAGLAAPDPSGRQFPTWTDHLHAALRTLCALLWLRVALGSTAERSHSPHPDHVGAATLIAEQAQDGDALFTVPLWAQRDPIVAALAARADADEDEIAGVHVLRLGGRTLWTEAATQDLPFPAGARNQWIRRLWVVRADEPMFGWPKLDDDVARDDLAWADAHLIPDGRWSLPGVDVRRYLPGPHPASPPRWTAWEIDLQSLPLQPPAARGCEDGRWRLSFRAAPPADAELLRAPASGMWSRDGANVLALHGGSCAGPAPWVEPGSGPGSPR